MAQGAISSNQVEKLDGVFVKLSVFFTNWQRKVKHVGFGPTRLQYLIATPPINDNPTGVDTPTLQSGCNSNLQGRQMVIGNKAESSHKLSYFVKLA